MAKGQIKQKQAKIDQKQFENLCKMQCTETEIMAWFEVCKDTLISWCRATYGTDFSTIYKEKKESGKISLRRFQIQQAEKNPTMAIWLGKQYLNQTDKVEQTTNADITINNKLADLLKINPEEEDGHE